MPTSIGGMRATLFTSAAAFGTALVGIFILAGGAQRFSAQAFVTARALAPWWTWGGLMLLAGVMALVGSRRAITWAARVGHMTACVIYLFLVGALITAVLQSPLAPMTGVGIYATFAFIHALAAVSADEGRSVRQFRRAKP